MRVSESVSEKPRRGRPRSVARELAETDLVFVVGNGCTRTRVDKAYAYRTIGYVCDLDDDDQRQFLGGTADEVRSGKASPPRGYGRFAVEFGRWSEQADDETIRDHLLDVAGHLRAGRVTFTRAAAHYRRNRIGKRAGTAKQLGKHLARALDEYLLRFPTTTPEAVEEAIVRLARADREVREASS